MNARVPANGQDMSTADFEDSAWDSNEMMREPGAPESDPIPDDDDLEDGAGGSELQADDAQDDFRAAEDDQGSDEDESDVGEPGEDDVESEGPEPIDPPNNWPAQERQFFTSLPPQLQHAYMARAQAMTADYTRKTQAIAQERQRYTALNQIIGPRVQQWALSGMNEAQAISQLIALSDFATQSPQEFIKYFANLRGIDLNQMTQAASEEYVDPQVSALRSEQARVQASLNQLAQQQSQWQQQQAAQQYRTDYQTVSSAIDEFASRVGRDGKPLYPHLDEVAETMAAYVNAGIRDLDKAYKMACQATPHVAARIAARSMSNQNARRRREVEEARRAAITTSGPSMGNGSIPTGDMSVRDLLHASWRGDIQ